MLYSIEPAVFELNPQLHFGILVGRGMKNTDTTSADNEVLRSAESIVRQSVKEEELRGLPNIKGYRATMEMAKINPNKFPPSTEAMIKRVLKGASLPTINAMVDLGNAISLENQISLGGHDLSDIHTDLSVCFTKGNERFLPFGAEEYEDVEAGELVFTSGDVVQTRKWIWRQSELGKMTLQTKDVFFQLVGFEDTEGSQLVKALDALQRLIVERFGGTFQRFMVTASNPSIEF